MKDSFKLYQKVDVLAFVNERSGEKKLGQSVQVVSSVHDIEKSTAKFVILGIPEDIGVRANFGIGGAKTAWASFLKALLNIQSNASLQGDEILVLGHFEIHEPVAQSIEHLRNKTVEIDALVPPIIKELLEAGKIPIVIGGGHNNALPIIAGASMALKMPINVINIDAHADLRNPDEGRHSGNGFSCALQKGYLNEYRMFGLHQNYLHENFPEMLINHSNLKAMYFEDLLLSPFTITENWANFSSDIPSPCGLEIDLDSIQGILSSAVTPSGLALNDVRRVLLANRKKFSYLHICEGAVQLTNGRMDEMIGKSISYLVTDFIKALLPHIYQRP